MRVCAIKMQGNDPMHKVTIVPRGRALGIAFTLPEEDRVLGHARAARARAWCMAYGGRVAEEIVVRPRPRHDGRAERHPEGDLASRGAM